MTAGDGLGRLGLWRTLRSRRSDLTALPDIPAGPGPLLLIHVARDACAACPQILHRLRRARPALRVMCLAQCGAGDGAPGPGPGPGPDPACDPDLARQIVDRAHPRAVLLLGSDLPPALIAAAHARRIPVIAAELRLNGQDAGWGLTARMRRHLLTLLSSVMVSDTASRTQALRMRLDPMRLAMTGPVSDIHEPLQCSETERASMAQQMNGRHAWFAASLPRSEEAAILDAHQAVLRRAHRALLILAPQDPARIDDLARSIEAAGLTVARRSEDEDFGDEIQVLLTDGPTEMGLWYRLAPVSFMGGTLSGHAAAMRHPFEPAALGSAIVHGPQPGPFVTEWRHLDGAQAARAVGQAQDLAQAMTDLTQPEQVATLASNAWMVSTGGADVALRIAERVLALIDAAPAPTPATFDATA